MKLHSFYSHFADHILRFIEYKNNLGYPYEDSIHGWRRRIRKQLLRIETESWSSANLPVICGALVKPPI